MRSFSRLQEESSGRTPYKKAFETALASFRLQDPLFAANHTGTAFDAAGGRFSFESMGMPLYVTYPKGEATWARDGTSLPLGWHLITINYLSRGDGRPLTGQLISYRELDGGHVFYPNLKAKTINPLAAKLGSMEPEAIRKVFSRYKGAPVGNCDLGATFNLFPRVPITVKLWLGDEEFPPSANILFDAAAGGYLHTEDAAAAASIVANCLMQKKIKLL